MPTLQYQITVSNFNGTTPCQSYSVYTGTTHDIDDADYVEDVNVPVSGYTLDLDIDSSYTGVYLFIEHCDGHINSVPSPTPKLQGGYQLVFVDLRCDTCTGERPPATPTPTITPTYSQTITPTYSQTLTPTYSQTITPTITLTPTLNLGETPTLTPTYSQTVTPTLTLTPTYSQTVTPTLTPTYSQTVTPTYSQTVTPTHTITITETPINEPTPTLTPTQTPINETPCNCYTVECTSGDGCPITYENCVGQIISVSIAGSYTTSICGNIVNLEQPNLIITNTGNACFFDGEIYTCLDCYCTTIEITQQDIEASDTNRVYVEVIPCSGGTPTTLQYGVAGIYHKCLQSVLSVYILVGGNQTAPSTSNTITSGVSCSTDNDCEQT
jgi:hypothetical protein